MRFEENSPYLLSLSNFLCPIVVASAILVVLHQYQMRETLTKVSRETLVTIELPQNILWKGKSKGFIQSTHLVSGKDNPGTQS